MITGLPEYKKRTSGMTSAVFQPPPQAQLSAPPMIEPGVYTLTDATWSMAMDLSGKDSKSLISYTKHSLDNQMWQIIPLGAGYCIRNVKSGLYVTVDNSLQEDTTLVATKYPVSWDIIVKGGITQRSEDGVTVVVKWPESDLFIGSKDKTLNTKLTLMKAASQKTASTQWKLALKRLGSP
ncbi:uncharacterized protein STEHIDRAFT_158446 [Stereum hirsutum FP-91666 SS1]|uniref:uncharacterized protein n=1 Tax=Stereum hirsutum (strain FP-91666) TaxID=721885 RepID=UPI0004449D40|nr:uncharacterized protein STEHIDRAFT_158446 [Stereum hirsutum FP-91666 SS1]EIM84730.1 hypothetical protein STEHIDRAFT_158446 [Stereum hirsutum FP-91666 SS1]